MSNTAYWRKLEEDFISFLTATGYTPDRAKQYMRTMSKLINYANANGIEAYTAEIGVEFLKSEARLMYMHQHDYRFQQTVIRRLDDYLDGERYSPSHPRANHECPESFNDVYEKYIEKLRSNGLKHNTVMQYQVFLVKLFQDFVNHGIDTWAAVNAQALTAAFSRSTNKVHFARFAKRLFKYLADEKIVRYNYSGILPKIHYFKRIPSVYSNDEIEKVLSSVNRSTDIGKRDYAILVLAARLGMCAADIKLLRFEEVSFEKKLIEFKRYKTGAAQRLSLLPEAADALSDYIDNARGDSAEQYIFLTSMKSVQRPVSVGVIGSVAAKYFRESGIVFGDRKHSSHAMRMSLASALVAENVPYDVVRRILGHEDPDAINHYVKLDVESLRSCALDVPTPSGHFAEYLTCGMEGHANV